MDNTQIHLVYITMLGKEPGGDNFYKLFLSDTPDDVFAEGWGEKPACNQSPESLMIAPDMFQYTAELRCDINLDLAQDSCCYTMQDCKDGIIAMAAENIDNVEEYPEEGRLVLHFGDTFEDADYKVAVRGYTLRINKR